MSRRSASKFWLFALITLLAGCGSLRREATDTPRPPAASPTQGEPAGVAALNLARTPAATPLFAEPTPTPYIWPTPPPSPTAVCPAAPRARLIVQERGRVTPDDPLPVRLRAGPGLDQRVLTQIQIREVFYVLEGPVCNNRYSWYKIRYSGQEGWIAEGALNDDGSASYFVEPYLPG